MTVSTNHHSDFQLTSNKDRTTTITLDTEMVPILEDLMRKGLNHLINDLSHAEMCAREDRNPEAIIAEEELTNDVAIVERWLRKLEQHSSRKD